MRIRIIIFSLFLVLILSFLIFYPQPMALIVSYQRLFSLPIDYNVEAIKPLLESSAGKEADWIEKLVKDEISYRYDWQNYNYPWYFPTVEEVLDKKSGDCKSRLIVLASILAFHETPFSLSGSVSHVWLDYDNKKEIKGEREQDKFFSYSEEKGLQIKKPETDWENSSNIFQEAVWIYMPQNKKTLLSQTWLSSFLFAIFSIMIIELKEKK